MSLDKKLYDALWINADIFTSDTKLGFIKNAALAVKDGNIAWIGRLNQLPLSQEEASNTIYDVNGHLITPGFIDCHTHLIYAGNRATEFELRLQGVSYSEIAQRGGGIQSTVKATRAASEQELLMQSLPRAQYLMRSGATCLEIKSGYGLDWDTESKILRVAKQIENLLDIEIKKTFLGAHTIPLEFKSKPDRYVDLICQQMIPQIAEEKLAESVDVFCENIAFNLQQTERIFQAASDHHLAIKCHAEQLTTSGAASLAAKYQALSVDHLEFLAEKDIAVLAENKTVAVLLPGAFYFLREKKLPPIKALQEAGIPIAIASDCNPGTSPVTSLLIILNMACTLFNLTIEEVLHGVTKNAAQALNIDSTQGTITPNKQADFVVWRVNEPAELAYYLGNNPLHQLVKRGKILLS